MWQRPHSSEILNRDDFRTRRSCKLSLKYDGGTPHIYRTLPTVMGPPPPPEFRHRFVFLGGACEKSGTESRRRLRFKFKRWRAITAQNSHKGTGAPSLTGKCTKIGPDPPLHHLPTLHRGSCTVLHTLGLEPTTAAEKGCHANHYTALCLVHYKSIHTYIHVTHM